MNRISERLFMTYCFMVGAVDRRERGASMTEYAILVAVMAGIVLILVKLLGTKLSNFITGISITT